MLRTNVCREVCVMTDLTRWTRQRVLPGVIHLHRWVGNATGSISCRQNARNASPGPFPPPASAHPAPIIFSVDCRRSQLHRTASPFLPLTSPALSCARHVRTACPTSHLQVAVRKHLHMALVLACGGQAGKLTGRYPVTRFVLDIERAL